MQSFRTPLVAMLMGVAAAIALAFAAAPAQAVPQSSEPAAQVKQAGEGESGVLDTGACVEFLESFYDVTPAMYNVCAGAELYVAAGGNEAEAIALCALGLRGLGVDVATAVAACILAVAPN